MRTLLFLIFTNLKLRHLVSTVECQLDSCLACDKDLRELVFNNQLTRRCYCYKWKNMHLSPKFCFWHRFDTRFWWLLYWPPMVTKFWRAWNITPFSHYFFRWQNFNHYFDMEILMTKIYCHRSHWISVAYENNFDHCMKRWRVGD